MGLALLASILARVRRYGLFAHVARSSRGDDHAHYIDAHGVYKCCRRVQVVCLSVVDMDTGDFLDSYDHMAVQLHVAADTRGLFAMQSAKKIEQPLLSIRVTQDVSTVDIRVLVSHRDIEAQVYNFILEFVQLGFHKDVTGSILLQTNADFDKLAGMLEYVKDQMGYTRIQISALTLENPGDLENTKLRIFNRQAWGTLETRVDAEHRDISLYCHIEGAIGNSPYVYTPVVLEEEHDVFSALIRSIGDADLYIHDSRSTGNNYARLIDAIESGIGVHITNIEYVGGDQTPDGHIRAADIREHVHYIPSNIPAHNSIMDSTDIVRASDNITIQAQGNTITVSEKISERSVVLATFDLESNPPKIEKKQDRVNIESLSYSIEASVENNAITVKLYINIDRPYASCYIKDISLFLLYTHIDRVVADTIPYGKGITMLKGPPLRLEAPDIYMGDIHLPLSYVNNQFICSDSGWTKHIYTYKEKDIIVRIYKGKYMVIDGFVFVKYANKTLETVAVVEKHEYEEILNISLTTNMSISQNNLPGKIMEENDVVAYSDYVKILQAMENKEISNEYKYCVYTKGISESSIHATESSVYFDDFKLSFTGLDNLMIETIHTQKSMRYTHSVPGSDECYEYVQYNTLGNRKTTMYVSTSPSESSDTFFISVLFIDGKFNKDKIFTYEKVAFISINTHTEYDHVLYKDICEHQNEIMAMDMKVESKKFADMEGETNNTPLLKKIVKENNLLLHVAEIAEIHKQWPVENLPHKLEDYLKNYLYFFGLSNYTHIFLAYAKATVEYPYDKVPETQANIYDYNVSAEIETEESNYKLEIGPPNDVNIILKHTQNELFVNKKIQDEPPVTIQEITVEYDGGKKVTFIKDEIKDYTIVMLPTRDDAVADLFRGDLIQTYNIPQYIDIRNENKEKTPHITLVDREEFNLEPPKDTWGDNTLYHYLTLFTQLDRYPNSHYIKGTKEDVDANGKKIKKEIWKPDTINDETLDILDSVIGNIAGGDIKSRDHWKQPTFIAIKRRFRNSGLHDATIEYGISEQLSTKNKQQIINELTFELEKHPDYNDVKRDLQDIFKKLPKKKPDENPAKRRITPTTSSPEKRRRITPKVPAGQSHQNQSSEGILKKTRQIFDGSSNDTIENLLKRHRLIFEKIDLPHTI